MNNYYEKTIACTENILTRPPPPETLLLGVHRGNLLLRIKQQAMPKQSAKWFERKRIPLLFLRTLCISYTARCPLRGKSFLVIGSVLRPFMDTAQGTILLLETAVQGFDEREDISEKQSETQPDKQSRRTAIRV